MSSLLNEPEAVPLFPNEEPAGMVDELARVTAECLRDPDSIASKRLLGQIFERELDELHTPDGSSYWSQGQKAARTDEERKIRDERLMMGAVGRVVGDSLRSHGVRLIKIDRDGETQGGGGYVVVCRDTGRREFTARFGLELAERLASSGGTSNLVERMGHAVFREILSERSRYFARMQQEESHG